MNLTVDDELRRICEIIQTEDLDLSKWREIESDDMFQTENYIGGFDATENAFCFSYFRDPRNELWIQITIHEVKKILSGKLFIIKARTPD